VFEYNFTTQALVSLGYALRFPKIDFYQRSVTLLNRYWELFAKAPEAQWGEYVKQQSAGLTHDQRVTSLMYDVRAWVKKTQEVLCRT
jgi:hypothetical protein